MTLIKSARSPTMITISKTFHQLWGGNPVNPLSLFYYCSPFTPHFIFALGLVDGCLLFCRNNTPFTSLHSLTFTEIGQSLRWPTQLNKEKWENPHVMSAHHISSAVYYSRSWGTAFIMFILSREWETPSRGKLQE